METEKELTDKLEELIERRDTLFSDLIKEESIPIPFVVEGMIAEKESNMISAATGAGKSLVALKIATDVAAGRKFLGEFETKQMKVYLMDLEMNRNTVRDRAKAFVDEEAAKNMYLFQGEFNIENDKDLEWLKGRLKELDIGLLIVDTLSSFQETGERGNTEMAMVNKRISHLRESCGITDLILHHDRKPYQNAERTIHNVRGPVELVAKRASVIMLDGFDSSVVDGRLILTLWQGKKRLAKAFKHCQVFCDYNEVMGKTTWIFDGYTSAKKRNKKVEIQLFAKECMGKDIFWSKANIMEEASKQKKAFKEKQVKDAMAELGKSPEVKFYTGELMDECFPEDKKRQYNENYYYLIERESEIREQKRLSVPSTQNESDR